MDRDLRPSEKPLGSAADDAARTEEAKRVVEAYATALREMISKLRRWFS